MRTGSLKTAASIASEHGQGIVLVVSGREWTLADLTVVDQPKDLAMCHGHSASGDLVLFDAEQVELVRVPVGKDGRKASVRGYPTG